MVNQNPVDRSRQRDSPRIAAYQAVVEIHQPSHPNPPGSPEPREPAPESCPQCPSLRRVFRDPFSRRTLWTTFLQEKIRSSTSYHSPTSYGKNIILSLDQQTAIATSKCTHPYQRGRASITELRLKLRKIMSTQRLIGVAVSRLVRNLYFFRVGGLFVGPGVPGGGGIGSVLLGSVRCSCWRACGCSLTSFGA